jgi:hypothetical protein
METGIPPAVPKARHGCLTAYLIFMLIANALSVASYMAIGAGLIPHSTIAPWIAFVLGVIGIVVIVFTCFLFAWKRWAFYGFCALAVLVFVFNLAIGVNPLAAVFGLLSPLILYAVLQIGGERKGWNQLE